MATPTTRTARLHVGVDADKTIVGPYPLKMRTGRARRHRWGSVTEVVPVPSTGRTVADRTRLLGRLGLALTVLSAALAGAGVPWWTAALGTVTVLAFVARDQARAAAVGTLALAGAPAEQQVLYARPERDAFHRTVAVAKRVHRTWPALRHMIDPSDAEPMLARALHDLADVLARRQQVRRLRDELAAVNYHDMPADSPAVDDLLEQRTQVEILWRELGAAANRHMAGINAAAVAGESLIRERTIGQTARAAQRTLAHLSASGTGRPEALPQRPEPGQELADRTAAVVQAYRELAARYGRGL